MKIGLASYEFINRNIPFNVAQMEKAMKAASGKVDLLCFGEAFLQGFDALDWKYESDRSMAVAPDSPVMEQICRMAARYGVDLLFGYLEKSGDAIYSSCAVVVDGKPAWNYRRISRGWKEYRLTDGHYREGGQAREFLYRGRSILIALCGDLWDFPERFRTDGLLIWPVYLNFTEEEWAGYEAEYAEQAQLAAHETLMVGSLSHEPEACGGAFHFVDGKIKEKLEFHKEGILIVEI